MVSISNPDGTTHYDSGADGNFEITRNADGRFTNIDVYRDRGTLPTANDIGVYALDILTRLTIQKQEQLVATLE